MTGKSKVQVEVKDNMLNISWPTGAVEYGKISFDLRNEKPLLSTIQVIENNISHTVSKDLDPAFIVNVGKKRFDIAKMDGISFSIRLPICLTKTYTVKLVKSGVKVISSGSHTQIKVDGATAGPIFRIH